MTRRRVQMGEWVVEPDRNRIVRGDREERLHPKVTAVLQNLIEHAGDVVTKDELIQKVWGGAFVTDEVVTNAVFELRKALGDDSRDPRYIQTIPRNGYRLVAEVSRQSSSSARAWRRVALLVFGAGALFAVGFSVSRMVGRTNTDPESVLFRVRLGDASRHPLARGRPELALSPDGRILVFVARDHEGRRRLFVRTIDTIESRPIAGTDGARTPFFSPNGETVAFFDGSRLNSVPVGGGEPTKLADAMEFWGGTWLPDDTIVFKPSWVDGLARVSASGRAVETLFDTADARNEAWPEALPGGKAILLTLYEEEKTFIAARSLVTGEERILFEGHFARFAATGHIVFARNGSLWAVRFDPRSFDVKGQPVEMVAGVRMMPRQAAQFALSETGIFAYVPGDAQYRDDGELVVVDREGGEELLVEKRRDYNWPRFSPDGRKLALTFSQGGNQDIWILDLETKRFERMTFSPSLEFGPVWSPDGRWIAFTSPRRARDQVFRVRTDGSGIAEELTNGPDAYHVTSWSPEGTLLLGVDVPDGEPDVLLYRQGRIEPLLQSPGWQIGARFSPDGRFIAYTSDETGDPRIYSRPSGPLGPPRQLSIEHSYGVVWSRDGREIFFRGARDLRVVSNPTGADPSPPRVLFSNEHWPTVGFAVGSPNYDVSPDGTYFVAVREVPIDVEILVSTGFLETLAKRVP